MKLIPLKLIGFGARSKGLSLGVRRDFLSDRAEIAGVRACVLWRVDMPMKLIGFGPDAIIMKLIGFGSDAKITIGSPQL